MKNNNLHISTFSHLQIVWLYTITGLFVALNIIFIAFDFYYFSLLPLIFLIIFLYLFAFDKLYFAIIFFIPLSINILIPDWNIEIGKELPARPLLSVIMFLFFARILLENNYDLKVTKHPVSIAIICYLIWVFFTSVTSQIPIVSFKFFLTKLWCTVCFYFIGIILFKNLKNIKNYIWLYALSMVIVIGYTLYNHSLYNFNEITSHWVMTPFFNDHTAYAASLAFLIPVFFYFTFASDYKISVKILSFIILFLLIVAIIFSYTRASWTSLIVAFVIFFIVLLKINYKVVFLAFAVLVGVLALYQNDLVYKIGKNKQQSSADFVKHIQSISNITNDVSNLERINRWHSALRMFYDYPIVGTGPGTYQFLYAPYQLFKEKTIISTNAGDRGNAHSEYLGPMAESGFMGTITVLSIVISSLIFAFKNHRIIKNKKLKYLNLSITLGLITYLVHGSMNNFLDTVKASALFWGFIAMIVSINIYHKDFQSTVNNESLN